MNADLLTTVASIFSVVVSVLALYHELRIRPRKRHSSQNPPGSSTGLNVERIVWQIFAMAVAVDFVVIFLEFRRSGTPTWKAFFVFLIVILQCALLIHIANRRSDEARARQADQAADKMVAGSKSSLEMIQRVVDQAADQMQADRIEHMPAIRDLPKNLQSMREQIALVQEAVDKLAAQFGEQLLARHAHDPEIVARTISEISKTDPESSDDGELIEIALEVDPAEQRTVETITPRKGAARSDARTRNKLSTRKEATWDSPGSD